MEVIKDVVEYLEMVGGVRAGELATRLRKLVETPDKVSHSKDEETLNEAWARWAKEHPEYYGSK